MAKRIFRIFKILLVISLPFFLFYGYKVAKEKIIFFLSNPMEFGAVSIIPQDFQGTSPLEIKWGSIKILFDSTSLFLEKPKIFLHPIIFFSTRRELLHIDIDSVHANINPQSADSLDSSKTDLKHLTHQDIRLPFRALLNVSKAKINVKETGEWELDSLVAVMSGRQKRLHLMASDIRGLHLAKKLFLNVDYRWSNSFSDVSLSVSDRLSDSVFVTLNAPRTQLENLSAEVYADIEHLPFWLKEKWPSEAPDIGKITLHSNLSANILTQKISFDLSLQTKIGEVWQLPVFNTAIKARGNNDGISQSEISLKGNNGESIMFKGNVDKNLDGNGELEISGIDIVFAKEVLPTDAKFHRITKRGNSVSTTFTTLAGSNFNVRIADLNNPVAIFDADIDSKEPWAVQWTGDMVKLTSPTILTGSFSFKEVMLRANLKTKVPFAYYATVDELDVSLWLDSEGIRFPKGTIKRLGNESSFTGEVMWDKEYFTFKLEQPSEGKAEIYGTLDQKIDLSLQNVNTVELPFADTTMLKGYNGIVSGNWVYDAKNRIGKASVALSTVIQNLTIDASSNVEILRDSLLVENFEIQQNYKKINGFLSVLLPSETRKEFEIQRARINIPNMDLVSLLATFRDSTLTSGYANGNLEFDKINGLRGEITFSQIALKGLNPNIANFPLLYFKAFGDSAMLSTRVFLGEGGFWSGNLEAGINGLRSKGHFPVYVSYTVKSIDNIGTLKFEGLLGNDFKNISGSTQIRGKWFLPDAMSEITDANLNIYAKTVLGKNVLDSLSATFDAKENMFERSILKIPFDLNGRIRNKMLWVDSVFAYGQQDEKITAKAQFDLAKASLKDLSFETEQFTFFLLDEHWIKIRDVTGKTKLNSDGITIFAELPSINYRMESPKYGTAHATAQGQASYKLPFQTEHTQTNESVTGNFEISRVLYTKNFDLPLDNPTHLYGAFKNAVGFIGSLMKEKKAGSSTERQALTSRPTTLDIRIQTKGMEAATIKSNLAEFPFAVNVYVLGTTRNILLNGDINAVAHGKIGYQELALFDLSSFRLYWQDLPLRQGEIDLQAESSYPFCSPDRQNDENCTIFMNVTGSLAQLNMQPTTSCNIEASPALIYYSMLLGCISDNDEAGGFDGNKFVSKIAGKFLSSTGNKILGGNVIGDIDLKWWSNETAQYQDTTYIRVPFSLSKFVPNLEAVFGYTSDVSKDPRYDTSVEVGLRYPLPIFSPADITRNFIDPSLYISTNLIRRSYHSLLTDSEQSKDRLEASIGLAYKHKFWDPCILRVGQCRP